LEDFNQRLIDEFRATDGKPGGRFADRDMILVTTTGARSGKRRTTPLVYAEVEGRPVVVGSAGGSDRHPAWYHNLVAHPVVTVEVGNDRYVANAIVLEEPERTVALLAIDARIPGFAELQAKSQRILPVIALERISDAESKEKSV
jgi:deazaflavin-dependent oxidoreductase (nitroreductase family)